MGINAFTYTGNTCVMTASTSAPTPIQVSSVTLGGTTVTTGTGTSGGSSSFGAFCSATDGTNVYFTAIGL